ncbi:hypothetical protein B6A14_06875 [Polynucleobacter hirudinilacicola]|uniref:Surface-adhesin protein E-like domain-containing protein n=1 Tax=Polynucleobacter hirudinilacicola TaxID=1743166 RepID=A0A210RWY1_9BURK|nr:surface-adhesin E family protein [Polynucleobacter hirudinilacicola]OWF65513.1 hypothetical protein B6A14_06875 [Polynucleobacter hirudinilacicola]
MNKILAGLLILIYQVLGIQNAHAYLQAVPGYVGDGSLYLETYSIVRNGSSASLMYVENFNQPQAYGSKTYLSKATEVRLDCSGKRIFALAEAFYSQADLQGSLLGRFPLRDEFGSTPAPGSWNDNLLNLGCGFSL